MGGLLRTQRLLKDPHLEKNKDPFLQRQAHPHASIPLLDPMEETLVRLGGALESSRTPRPITRVNGSSPLFHSCAIAVPVAGGLMVAVGIYARLSKEGGAVDSLLADPSLVLLAVGVLVFCVTFVGCLGALRDVTLLLKAFAWLLLVIFVLQVVAAVLGFLFSGMVMEKATLLMGQAIARYRDNLDLQNLIDYIQKKFECCGVHSYKDWSQNVYFDCQESNPSLESCAVPFSCCVRGKEAMLNTMCGYGTQKLKPWKAEFLVHTEGCLEKTVRWGRSNLFLVAGLAFGLLVLEVVVFSLAVLLIYQIDFIIEKRKSTRRRRSKSCPAK